MPKKTIWLNPPLERLAEECGKAKGRDGKFSSRLGDIVERFDLIIKLTLTPELNETERMILGEVLCGSTLTTVSIRYLHESILEAVTGSEEERRSLSVKASKWSAAEVIAVIESLGI